MTKVKEVANAIIEAYNKIQDKEDWEVHEVAEMTIIDGWEVTDKQYKKGLEMARQILKK